MNLGRIKIPAPGDVNTVVPLFLFLPNDYITLI